MSNWEDVQPEVTRVSLIDALLQIRGCLGDDAFFVTLESALRKRVLSERGRRRLREKITESARWLVEFARSDVIAAARGFDTLRFDYEMVINDWTVVEDAILAKVDAGLHLSPWAERVRRG